MPKLMVLSDSHRASEKIARAAEVYKQGGFDAAVHLGDVFPDARKFAALTGCTPLCVRGNCDGPFADAPDERIETLDGAKLLLAHGDRYGVKSSLTRLSYRAEELGCAAGAVWPYAPRLLRLCGRSAACQPRRAARWQLCRNSAGGGQDRPPPAMSGIISCILRNVFNMFYMFLCN